MYTYNYFYKLISKSEYSLCFKKTYLQKAYILNKFVLVHLGRCNSKILNLSARNITMDFKGLKIYPSWKTNQVPHYDVSL